MLSKKQIQKKKIQTIEIDSGDWNSSMFPLMANNQLFDVVQYLISTLLKGIRTLKKRLRHTPNIVDVGVQQLYTLLMKELRNRFVIESNSEKNFKQWNCWVLDEEEIEILAKKHFNRELDEDTKEDIARKFKKKIEALIGNYSEFLIDSISESIEE